MPKRSFFILLRLATGLSLLLVLSACNASVTPETAPPTTKESAPTPAPNKPAVDQVALVKEVSATLQACSYDGEPVSFKGKSGNAPSDCRDMVARIMNFTGLPQNFVVVQADVPNAAAVIVLDDQQIPKRVIAFNPQFIDVVRQATHGNTWAPVSIMAHEIGHHLSGHTITPGGSQPPTELEADKFSGFVLYKMGAGLDDAQTALEALVPEGPDGKTHPGRGKRLSAVREGWQQACVQQHGSCTGGKPAPLAATTPPSTPTPTTPASEGHSRDIAAAVQPEKSVGSMPTPREQRATSSNVPATHVASVDHLPAPGSIPSKFDRFIYDEYGMLDPSIRATFEAKAVEHAHVHGVEIVTMLVRDLHGMGAKEYALAMMRQLRVGKLDVGNGAVIVVAPDQGQAAVVWGPGIAAEMRQSNPVSQIGGWLKTFWPICVRYNGCRGSTENLLATADHIMRDTDEMEWTVRYQSLAAMWQASQDKPEGSDTDPTVKKIATFEGTVIARDVKDDYAGAFVNPSIVAIEDAVHVQTADGFKLMVYVVRGTELLMPGGELKAGGRYQFVARSNSILTHNKNDTQSFDLLSYSHLD
ncbi:MAG: TPM domain-containing protein [Dokdonella sp.]